MSTKFPKTPFSTRLSGNARETELRLRSMFQWQKKRPPMILFVLVLLLTVSCGGLVSCRQAGNEEVWHLGNNADILDIDEENRILYVRDSGEQYEVFGQRCALACGKAEEEGRLIYVDYETHELTRIPFEEFQVGDSIMVALTDSQYQAAKDASAQVMQIQLDTQRLESYIVPSVQEEPAGQHTFNFLVGDFAQSIRYRIYRLVDGKWRMECGSDEEIGSMDRQLEFTFNRLSDGVYISLDNSEPKEFMCGRNYGDEFAGMDCQTNLLSEQTGITYGEEIPLAIQVLTSESEITGYTVDTFHEPQKWEELGYEGVFALTVQFSKESLRQELHESGKMDESSQVTIDNHGAWTIEEPKKELSSIGRNWLADLPVAELPKEAAELRDLTRYDMWRDMLIPLAYDEEADVTVYGVISNEFRSLKNEIPLDLYELESDGIVIRCGNKAAYHPLHWGEHLWSAGNPELHVNDFDGDGENEAGVVFLVGHGTGCSVRQLYIFELDSLTYSVPDHSTLDIHVTYDPNTRQAVLNSGEESVTVEVPEGVPEFEGAYIGNIIDFTYEDGQFYFNAELDFYRTLAYLAEVKAPVVYEDGQYCLGEITSLTAID